MNYKPYSFRKRQDLRNMELTHLTLWAIKELKRSLKEKKNYHKGKKETSKLKVQPTQIYKKDIKNEKCHFCNKHGNFAKDCLKRKVWFEKKGKSSALVCFKSNLAKVPYNTWWIDFGCTTHVLNTMYECFTIQTINPN